MAELVDAHDSKSCSARSGGSIPSTGTNLRSRSGAKVARRSLGDGGRCQRPRASVGKPASGQRRSRRGTLSEDQKFGGGRRCPDCLEPVPFKVRICPNCKAYQDWRRYVGMGQTELALLVALASVSTTLLNITLPLLKPASSNIQVVFESMSGNTANFIARNEGRSGGVLQIDQLAVAVVAGEMIDAEQPIVLNMATNTNIVATGQEQSNSLNRDTSHDTNLCGGLQDYMKQIEVAHPKFHSTGLYTAFMDNLACSFNIKETSFNMVGDGHHSFTVDCRNLSLMRDCARSF